MPTLPAGIAAALEHSEVVHDRAAVERAVDQLAIRIALELHDRHPVLIAVMNGGMVIATDLLMRLRFPLEIDYLHVTRYGDDTRGGELEWRALPRTPLAGRTVLVVDDIFDVGITLSAAVERMRTLGAIDVRTAVLARKEVDRAAALEPDFVGLAVPDRYVFGRGMDFRGHWRNLPEIRALAAGDVPA